MSVWLECLIGMLAAIGLICILKALYDALFGGYLRSCAYAELFLYGSGTDADTAQWILAAEQVRKLYFPNLHIIFAENGEADTQAYNIAQTLCERYQVEYIE